MCVPLVLRRRLPVSFLIRRAFFAAAACAAVMLTGISAHAQASLVVTTLADSTDSSCSASTCSLRDAITQANTEASGTVTTITFQTGLGGTLKLLSALPEITASMTIQGPTTGTGVTISGADKYTIFTIGSETVNISINISNLTLEGGLGSGSAPGAILSEGTTNLTVTDSTFVNNKAAVNAGAILFSAETLTVTNSTFVGNTAEAGYGQGGAIVIGSGTATLINDTFYGNTAARGDAISNSNGTLVVENSILSDSGVAGSECAGLSCPTNGTDGNYIGTGAMLLPLGNYGGTTPTMLPLPGSPVIGAGSSSDVPSGTTTDQRGFALTSTVDAGAVQTNYTQPTALTSSYTGMQDLDLSKLTSPATSTEVKITSGVTNFIGTSADKLTVQGNGGASVFTVDSGAQAAFYGMTISGGGGLQGGGINNSGTATILDGAVTGNSTGGGLNFGKDGGISNGGVLTIIASTISGNKANNTTSVGGSGGGIGNTGSLTMINSTVSGNDAFGSNGGGINNSGTAVLTNVTISANSAAPVGTLSSTAGGGIYAGGTLTLTNDIVEGNSAASFPDIDPLNAPTENGGNLVNATPTAIPLCSATVTTSCVDLAALANNGGPTETMLPVPLQDVTDTNGICVGEKSLAVDQNGLLLTTDQRGFSVGASTYCASGTGAGTMDAGAVQTDYTLVAFTNAGTSGYAGIVNQPVNYPAAPIVQVTENGQIVGGVPVTLTYTGSNALAGATATTVAGTTTTGGATFSALESTATGSGALSVTLQLNSSKTLASTITPELTINAALTLATTSLANGAVASSYTAFDFNSVTSGGSGTGYTYAISSGSLPSGMVLAASGALSGIPTAGGAFSFTVKATDSNNNTATQSYTLTVDQATTSILLSSSQSPALPNTAVTFTATLSPTTSNTTSADFTKAVTFNVNGAPATCTNTGAGTVSVSGGVATATCTVDNLATSSTAYNITASYPNGDPNYTSANSPVFQQTVSLSGTTTSVVSSANPSNAGQPVTFTATVTNALSGATTAPTGTVNFTSDGTTITGCGTQALTGATSTTATASCTTSALAASTTGHAIVANYSGTTSTFAASSGTLASAQVVKLNTASTGVQSSSLTSTVGQSVTFTATVTGNADGGSPTGNVRFSGVSDCTAQPLTGGPNNTSTATCSTNALALNTSGYSITATYSGDGGVKYAPSQASAAITQVVNLNTAATAVTSSPLTSTVGQSVTFTATVTGNADGGSPTGNVRFSGVSDCTAQPLTAGANNASTATCTTSALALNTSGYSITATYSGDGGVKYSPSQASAAITQVVNLNTATTAVASSSLTSTVNQLVTFTATVTGNADGGAPTGTVSFSGVPGCTAQPLTAGASDTSTATCATSALAANTTGYSITATYQGDGKTYSASPTSSPITQVVNGIASSIALSVEPGASTSVNQSVTFTASVMANGAPVTTSMLPLTGSVAFTDNGSPMSCAVSFNKATGVATCAVSNLPLGANAVIATYAGDTNYTTSSATVTQNVGQATTSVAVVANPVTPTVNGAVTLTATVTPTPSGSTQLSGKLSFTDNGNPIAGCTDVAINPSSAQAVCTTSALPLGANTITAQYGSDTNFAGSTGTTKVTVAQATTSLTLTSSASGNASTVNQPVTFAATVSGASGISKFAGKMSFTADGSAIAGCTLLPVDPTTGSASCTTTALAAGTRTIAASYTGDPNFANGTTSLTETVAVTSSSLTLNSAPNPSVVANPKNLDDVVTLAATVSPSNGGVPLSGTVSFTDNGIAIAGCGAEPVNTSGVAMCSATFSTFGTHSIIAVYGNDPNYTSSRGAATQQVQDYSLTMAPSTAVSVTQGSTNANDPFTPQTITISSQSFGGFTGNLALTCSVAAVTTPQGAVLPTCSLSTSTLAVASSSASRPVTVTINTGSGSNVATPGTYAVSVTGVDATTGLMHATAALTVYVRNAAPPISLVSGATTGNTGSLNFTLPAGVGITSFQCVTATGPTLSEKVNPSGLGMGCAFNPGSISAAGTIQNASTTVTISTNVPLSQARLNRDDGFDTRGTIAMAGMAGVPILLLLGFLPGGRRTRRIFFRYLGIVLIAVLLFGGISGCGGGSFTPPKSVSGTTPPGTYELLVQGAGTDGHTYEAVVTVNVTR